MHRFIVLILLLMFVQVARGASCESDVLQAAFTPRLDYWWSPTIFKVTEPVEVFLNSGAARVLAARENGASMAEQLRLVVAHVREHVDYAPACAYEPPSTFASVLERKQGACLQINLLAAAVLARSGFRASIASREPSEGWGHLWIEVGEGVRTLVVDATRDDYVVSLVNLRKAEPSSDAFESQWYLHPERVLRKIQ